MVPVSRSPGCAAVVGVRRSVVWEAGRGKADLTTGRAPTSKSMFEMASNSERFTADAVLLLAGRRQLALNEPLSDYLDNSQAWAREVTLGDLMRHTSGIPDYQDLLEAKGMELMDPASTRRKRSRPSSPHSHRIRQVRASPTPRQWTYPARRSRTTRRTAPSFGEGLVWPGLAWMAATLFALAAFRNTAPGTPPIGCVLDWFAFLWAETIIALCLITVVITGVNKSLRQDAPPT